MQKVYKNLKEIEEVVKELLPPRLNKYIGSFQLSFLLSSDSTDLNGEKEVTLVAERGITYQVKMATIDEELEYLQSILDPHADYSDDPGYWRDIQYIKNRINMLKSKL